MSEKITLNRFEYAFLKGDRTVWPTLFGPAYLAVGTWCRRKDFGRFGEPTLEGLKVMREYEDPI